VTSPVKLQSVILGSFETGYLAQIG